MEEEGSVATSCMAVTRFMVPSGTCTSSVQEVYHTLCHDPLFSSSPCPPPVLADSAMDSSEVANLLTDMLTAADFPHLYQTSSATATPGSSSSRYTIPDILQFPAAADVQASKITLLQMLEDTTTDVPAAANSSSSFTHLKLPVLEEPNDHHKLPSSGEAEPVQVSVIPVPTPPAAPAGAGPVSSSSEIKPCKVEPTDSVLLYAPPPLLGCEANRIQINSLGGGGNTSSTENSGENGTKAAAQGGGSQSSSGTETPTPCHQSPGRHHQQQQRPKRKRIKSCKNSEEVESQRQTHIAVERNRRKQMNEHLNVLRSLMPGSYVQRGDQASIIGGAIEFVKELEQLLQCLQAQKRRRIYSEAFSPKPSPSVTSMLQHHQHVQQQQQQQSQATFFASPTPPGAAYSETHGGQGQADSCSKFVNDNFYEPVKEVVAEAKSEAADIEVKMVGSSDAVVKILSQRRPGQLLKTISALESMCMSIVHTNITTIEQTVLYSFTVRIGMESRLAVEEIAEAIQRAFTLIHNSSACSSAA